MTQGHLQIEKNEALEKLDAHLRKQQLPDGLMNLIGDPQYEFHLDLSSRMLNYYEANGFIRFHRPGTSGKRRFSLAQALGYQFSLYLKSQELTNVQISQLNDVLNEPSRNGLSDWDRLVYIGTASLGILEIWAKYGAKSGAASHIHLTTQENAAHFPLSGNLREIFFDKQGNLNLHGKSKAILPKLIDAIDSIREKLGWEKMSPEGTSPSEAYETNSPEGEIDSKTMLALQQLPASEYAKRYDILHMDESGNWYGVEIKMLKVRRNTQLHSEIVTSSFDELKQAVENEIRFLQKMREKLTKRN